MTLIRHRAFSNQYEAIGHTAVKTSLGGLALFVNFTAPNTVAKRLTQYLAGPDYRAQDSLIAWGYDVNLGFPEEIVLQDIVTPLPGCGLRNIIVAHPGFSAKGLCDEVYFFSLDGSMPKGFVYRIQHALNVPIQTHLEAAVWAVLINPERYDLEPADNPLQPLWHDGVGIAWQLLTDDALWIEVLRRAMPLAAAPPCGIEEATHVQTSS